MFSVSISIKYLFIMLSKCIHLMEWFDYHNHICMVFELLGQSVFDFLKSNDFRPFPLHHIQQFAKQILTSVACKSDSYVNTQVD